MPLPTFVALLGAPHWQPAEGGAPVVFTAERPFQLLAYLAARQTWVRRDELAALFWPDRDATAARSNLRKVLLLVRRLPGVGEFEQRADLVRWAPPTDLAAFERALGEGRFDDAEAFAGMRLMDGLDSHEGGEFGAWLRHERRRLDERWSDLCREALAAAEGEPERLRRVAERVLAYDGIDELAAAALARAHDALGRRDLARSVLDRHAGRLRDELAIEPSLQTQALREALAAGVPSGAGAGAAAAASAPPPRPAPAPAADGRFIGRRNELLQLRRLFDEPECRLLTVLGFAGLGKSTLARQVVHELDPATGWRVAWSALDDLTAASEVPVRLAQAFGLRLAGEADAWAEVAREIARSVAGAPAVLVLDSAEHLDLREPLERLLDGCATLRLLVTSRERLGVRGEWLVPVDGLPVPDEDEDDPDVLLRYDSVRLFEARARPFQPGFDGRAHAPAVARLVTAVGGSPLAIELAAAWMRVMPVADIAAELEQSVELLEAGVEPGRRGLRAGFDRTWQRLDMREREALANLARLPGDFGRAMAQQVAGAPLAMLAALVDRSLLKSDETGRFAMHPLIRQWAAPAAASPDALAVAHLEFVSRWLGRVAGAGADAQPPGDADIDRELAHVRAAWRLAVAQRDLRSLQSMSVRWSAYCENRGIWNEGVRSLQAALDALAAGASATPSVEAMRAESALLRGLVILLYRSGRLAEAEAAGRRFIQVARAAADSASVRRGLNGVGLSLWQQGRLGEARRCFEQGRRSAARDGDEIALAAFTSNVALVDKALGRYDLALGGIHDALALHRRNGKHDGVVTLLNNLANIHRVQQRHAEALACLDEAAALCAREGLLSARPFVFVNRGLTLLRLGQTEAAGSALQRAREEASQNGEPMIEASAWLGLAEIDVHAGRAESARMKVDAALRIAERLPSAALVAQCVFAHGEIEASLGATARGVSMMGWALDRSALGRADRDESERRLATWAGSAKFAPLPAAWSAAEVLAGRETEPRR